MLQIDDKNFENEITNSDLPIVLDFWAPWCGPCQMMGPVFEELSKEFEGKAKFAKLNTDEQPQLAQPYGIQGIPTLLVLKDGKEVDRIVGFLAKPALKQKIDAALEK